LLRLLIRQTCSDGSGNTSFADLAGFELSWSLHIVPVFFGEWIDAENIQINE